MTSVAFRKLITKDQKDHLKLRELSSNFKNYEKCSCVSNLSSTLKPNNTSNCIYEMAEGKENYNENIYPSVNKTGSCGHPAIVLHAVSQGSAG